MKNWWQNFMRKRLWVTPQINHWQYEHFNRLNRELLDNIQYISSNLHDLTEASGRLDRRLDALEFLKDAVMDRNEPLFNQRLFYDSTLAARSKILLETLDGQATFLSEDDGGIEATFNTSIVKNEDGFIAAARLSNAAYRNDTKTVYNETSTHYSRIKIFHLSRKLDVMQSYIIDDSLFRGKFAEAQFGFEDLRLFRWNGRLWAAAVAVSPGSPGCLKTTYSLICIEGKEVTECYLLKSPRGRMFEKNWIPIVEDNGRLMLIYNFDPLVLLEFEPKEQKLVAIGQNIVDLNDHVNIRGATNIIKIERGLHLCMVRLENFRLEGKLVYIHKWAVLNSNYEIVETSEPFFMMRRGIEFAAGLVDDGDDLIVSLGVADRRAALLRVSKRKVFDTLITLRT